MQTLKELFQTAVNNSITAEFIFTILRVSGIEKYKADPLTVLEKDVKTISDIDALKQRLRKSKDIWAVIFNLILNSHGKRYRPDLMTNAAVDDYFNLGMELLQHTNIEPPHSVLPDWDKWTVEQYKSYLSDFFHVYKEVLSELAQMKRYHKLPNKFDTFELITNDGNLVGFNMHFKDGSHSSYTRRQAGTLALNLDFTTDGLGFFLSGKNSNVRDWRVGDKRLYEIPLEGKYNDTGYWKPLIHPGDIHEIGAKAKELAQGNRDAQGIFFYMLVTGHSVIEFVMKGHFSFPGDELVIGNINVARVKHNDDPAVPSDVSFENTNCYDCWVVVEDRSLEGIINSLDKIQRTINTSAFVLNTHISWQLKYPIYNNSRGATIADKDDLMTLQNLLIVVSNQKNTQIDSAIDWYRRGQESKNIFNAFLSHFIAIEGLAISLANGAIEASEAFGFSQSSEQIDEKIAIIRALYTEHYETDPIKFAEKAYFDGVKSINSNLKKAFIAVFGESHRHFDSFFKGNASLVSLRGSLAHGDISDWTIEDKEKLWKSLPLLEDIAREFIYRIATKIKPEDTVPNTGTHRMLSMKMDNPTSVGIASDLKALPKTDWAIKSEWMD